MTFGEKLKSARKKAGLSQEQLAEKMSVSRSAIAKWESDKGMPDVNNLKVMSSLLIADGQENLNNHLIGVSCGKCDNTAGGV